MEQRVGLHAILPVFMALVITACASGKPAPPAVDPVKEQVLTLQKQLLELQALQIETRRKLDEQTTLTETLSTRLKTMEEQRSSSSRISPSDYGSAVGSTQTSVQTTSPEKKKQKRTIKKKKKKKSRPVRRQEQ